MPRKRFNSRAVCSSSNYVASKRAHLAMLQESHSTFSGIAVSGKIEIDVPVTKGKAITPKYRTIKVFGKDMVVSIEEYNAHCKHLGI